MDECIELDIVSRQCGIDSHSMYKTLLKHGNKYGYKVMGEVGSRTVVCSHIAMLITELIATYEATAPEITEIISGASNSIKFAIGHVVYFLVNGSSIVYIGQTTSLATRVGEHIKSKQFDSIYCIEHKNAIAVEAFCINKYKPPLNIETYELEYRVDMCVNHVLKCALVCQRH